MTTRNILNLARSSAFRIAIVCATVAACASDRSVAPAGTVLTDAQVSADVAMSTAPTTSQTLSDQSNYLSVTGVAPAAPSPDGLAPAPTASTAPKCTYDTPAGRWNCAPFTDEHGLTVTRSYAYFDATGAATKTYNDLTTAKIVYMTEAHGAVGDGVNFTGVTHRTSTQVRSGLLGHETTRRWDAAGVSADTNTHTGNGVTRHYAGATLDSLRAVIYPQPRTSTSYPLSGQAIQVANFTVTTSGKSNETRSVQRRVVTTFNGSSTATVQTGNVTCTLHLDTHKVDGCSHG